MKNVDEDEDSDKAHYKTITVKIKAESAEDTYPKIVIKMVTMWMMMITMKGLENEFK